MLMLRRQVGQEICRCFYLDGADLFEPPPDRDPLSVTIGRQTEEKQQPRGRLHHVTRSVMKYVLQIVFALVNPRFIGEIFEQ